MRVSLNTRWLAKYYKNRVLTETAHHIDASAPFTLAMTATALLSVIASVKG